MPSSLARLAARSTKRQALPPLTPAHGQRSAAHQRLPRGLAAPAGRRGFASAPEPEPALGRPAGSEPLRILFCGSDAFSCVALRTLHAEHVRNSELVEKLDVMVLPARLAGRGFRELRYVPCGSLAEQLGLQVHRRGTFTGWELPEGINLIVAVSFGLFVPPRILGSAKYGGLNVHPSLLPDLRGPAPIHRAMLRADEHIGVSLQTLHDTYFDHGTVLAQTPAPGLAIRPGADYEEVSHQAAVAGANMLVQGLRDGLHMPPYRDAGWKAATLEGQALTHAPKVVKDDARIDWGKWRTAEDFTRRTRVFSGVWTHAARRGKEGGQKRVLMYDAAPVARKDVRGIDGKITFLQPACAGSRTVLHERIVILDEESGSCAVHLGGAWVRITKAKVDGTRILSAAKALKAFFVPMEDLRGYEEEN